MASVVFRHKPPSRLRYDERVELGQGLSVVVPVYRSERTLRKLVDRVSASVERQDFEIILVDDASEDGTWKEISAISKGNTNVKGLRLGRNSGQHGALLAGVRAAQFSTIVTLDDDLQNPPEEISKLVTALSPEIDVVYGMADHIDKENHAFEPYPTEPWNFLRLHEHCFILVVIRAQVKLEYNPTL